MSKSNMIRRNFLKRSAGLGFASSSLVGTLGSLAASKAFAADSDDYRALVCVFLFGGNDSYNMLVPKSAAAYNEYAQARQNLAVPNESLLAINPAVSDGNDYGVTTEMPNIRDLFDNGELSFVANMGALVEPTSVEQYQEKDVDIPPNLYSHNSQQDYWQSVEAYGIQNVGWAGRMADLLADTTNGGSALPMNTSLFGNNLMQVGEYSQAYNGDPAGAPCWISLDNCNSYNDWSGFPQPLLDQRRQVLDDLYASSHGSIFERNFANMMRRSLSLSDEVGAALSSVPEPTTAFAGDPLSAQLRAVSHLIAARNELGMNRQIFFVGLGGFDTHKEQLTSHPELMVTLDAGLSSFQLEMEAIGCANSVTTFTASDFGRTLISNGDGSDHGWGSHQIVMGGAVNGRHIVGNMPALIVDGPQDAGQGRIIPDISVDQYGATLASWFGVPGSNLFDIFPNLENFDEDKRDLGLFL